MFRPTTTETQIRIFRDRTGQARMTQASIVVPFTSIRLRLSVRHVPSVTVPAICLSACEFKSGSSPTVPLNLPFLFWLPFDSHPHPSFFQRKKIEIELLFVLAAPQTVTERRCKPLKNGSKSSLAAKTLNARCAELRGQRLKKLINFW